METTTENRVGYKKTKLGWIPEEWQVVKLDDVLHKFQNGYAFSAKGYSGNGVPIITMAQIGLSGSFQFDITRVNFWPNNELEKLSQYKVEEGALIISMTDVTPGKNLIGRMAIVNEEGPFLLNQRVGLLYVNTDQVSAIFLKELSNNKVWRSFSKSHATLGVQANLSTKDIKGGKIPLPPLPEQQKIASILSTWDKSIDKIKQLIATKEERKKGLMQQLLTGKKRFAGFTDDWKEVRLGDVFEIVGGGTPDTTNESYWNGEIQWFTPTEIKAKFISKSERTITSAGLAKSSAKKLPVGTLLFTSRATIGDVGIAEVECTTNQGFQSFLPSKKGSISFLYYWVLENRKEFIRRSSGSTFLEINKKEMQKINIHLPSMDEQQKIASILSAADKEIELLNQELNNLQQQKKGLMQVLLTGKVRVNIK